MQMDRQYNRERQTADGIQRDAKKFLVILYEQEEGTQDPGSIAEVSALSQLLQDSFPSCSPGSKH